MNAYSSVHKVTGIEVCPIRDLGEDCITRKVIACTDTGNFEFLMFGVSMDALTMAVPEAVNPDVASLLRMLEECADYLACIPGTSEGGDDEALNLCRKAREATALYAAPFSHAKELERFRWLKEDATAEQWERISHALDVDAEIDAIRRGEMT